MITPADPLPDDLETAHQLIRELLETLGQQLHLNAKLQHQLEQLLRQRYGRKSERVDPAQLLLFAQEILARGRARAHSTTRPGPRVPAPSGCAPAQEEGPRPKAAPREPAPQAGPARRPPRTTPVPRLRHRAAPHRRGSPRAARIRPRVAVREGADMVPPLSGAVDPSPPGVAMREDLDRGPCGNAQQNEVPLRAGLGIINDGAPSAW